LSAARLLPRSGCEVAVEIVFVIALVYGAAFAIDEGTKYAGRAVRQRYRERVIQLARGGPSGASGALGTRLAAGTATALTVGVLAGRSFAAGAKAGWPEGKQRAYDRWGHLRRGDEPLPGSETEPGEATEPEPTSSPEPEQPHLTLVDPAPAAVAIPKGTTVTIQTSTGGEVLTMDQLISELDTITEEAASDLEDAQGDARRATEDAQRIDVMVASLRSMDLDEETIGQVSALQDSASARQAAADQRAAAADSRHAQAMAAKDGVQARHTVMREAHAATPHAADKQFYGG
jgi:ribosomal protein L12E/L44/L45/RPP1/RPP2